MRSLTAGAHTGAPARSISSLPLEGKVARRAGWALALAKAFQVWGGIFVPCKVRWEQARSARAKGCRGEPRTGSPEAPSGLPPPPFPRRGLRPPDPGWEGLIPFQKRDTERRGKQIRKPNIRKEEAANVSASSLSCSGQRACGRCTSSVTCGDSSRNLKGKLF